MLPFHLRHLGSVLGYHLRLRPRHFPEPLVQYAAHRLELRFFRIPATNHY